MAQVVDPAAVRLRLFIERLPLPKQLTLSGLQKPRHEAQEAGFTAAVGTRQDQRLARPQRKAEPGEDEAFAPFASQILSLEKPFVPHPRARPSVEIF